MPSRPSEQTLLRTATPAEEKRETTPSAPRAPRREITPPKASKIQKESPLSPQRRLLSQAVLRPEGARPRVQKEASEVLETRAVPTPSIGAQPPIRSNRSVERRAEARSEPARSLREESRWERGEGIKTVLPNTERSLLKAPPSERERPPLSNNKKPAGSPARPIESTKTRGERSKIMASEPLLSPSKPDRTMRSAENNRIQNDERRAVPSSGSTIENQKTTNPAPTPSVKPRGETSNVREEKRTRRVDESVSSTVSQERIAPKETARRRRFSIGNRPSRTVLSGLKLGRRLSQEPLLRYQGEIRSDLSVSVGVETPLSNRSQTESILSVPSPGISRVGLQPPTVEQKVLNVPARSDDGDRVRTVLPRKSSDRKENKRPPQTNSVTSPKPSPQRRTQSLVRRERVRMNIPKKSAAQFTPSIRPQRLLRMEQPVSIRRLKSPASISREGVPLKRSTPSSSQKEQDARRAVLRRTESVSVERPRLERSVVEEGQPELPATDSVPASPVPPSARRRRGSAVSSPASPRSFFRKGLRIGSAPSWRIVFTDRIRPVAKPESPSADPASVTPKPVVRATTRESVRYPLLASPVQVERKSVEFRRPTRSAVLAPNLSSMRPAFLSVPEGDSKRVAPIREGEPQSPPVPTRGKPPRIQQLVQPKTWRNSVRVV
ncbi:MAG: hypothetical protein VX278_01815, partial [Myxococcota bacterium]|nr:hypothetical protein [Myxococcota bacterium]